MLRLTFQCERINESDSVSSADADADADTAAVVDRRPCLSGQAGKRRHCNYKLPHSRGRIDSVEDDCVSSVPPVGCSDAVDRHEQSSRSQHRTAMPWL